MDKTFEEINRNPVLRGLTLVGGLVFYSSGIYYYAGLIGVAVGVIFAVVVGLIVYLLRRTVIVAAVVSLLHRSR